jgi:hypothetical protein
MTTHASLLDEARDSVLRQYGDDIGKRREELITPALVLDVDAASATSTTWRAS